ncbi:MAG: sigma-70 family RNA polymerase sigma factor [Myxococcaceae bacterium]|nr:sigma-70 family RNA polymerase sigma factor [Myxococcaceae bacterium]
MPPDASQEQQAQEDRDLLARAQAGDISAFEALVERHRDHVFGLAMRMTRSEADAAEITQDTFLSAYQHLGTFRGDAAFGSWVYRIAANNALMRMRRQRVKSAAEQELSGPDFNERGALIDQPSPEWARAGEDQLIDAELGQAIRQATEKLPDAYREVFLLKDVDGLSYEEIAEITGDSVPAIKSRLHRARLALREAIDAFYREKS